MEQPGGLGTGARRCSRCPFTSTSPTYGGCSGRVQNKSAGRILATDAIGDAVRSNRTTTNPARRTCDLANLTTITNVSVDGVMQGLGGPDEDRSGGFERGGWALPLFDNEAATFVNQVYQRADAFLFGRRTTRISPAPGEQ